MYRIIKSDNNTKNNPKYPPLHPKPPPPPQGFFILMHNVLQHPHTCTSTKHDWPGIQRLSCYKTDDWLFGGSGGYVSRDCLLWRYTIFPYTSIPRSSAFSFSLVTLNSKDFCADEESHDG